VNITKSLSFGDVLLVPEYSDLMHKSDADITYTYSNFTSVPVINAPMLAVTSIPLLHYLSNIKGYPVSVHRYYNTVDDQINSLYSWGNEKTNWNRVFVSVGSVYKWQEWIDTLIHFHVLQHPIAFLVDMAHGNTKTCVDTVKYIRNVLPKANIMAGNIATSDGMIRLVDAGANYIRCSIGGGCFVPDTPIKCQDGIKKIKDVEIGDIVITHNNRYKPVINKFVYGKNEKLSVINNIKCTKNHEFYVIAKIYKDIITDENIHQYAKWLRADELTKDYMLLQPTLDAYDN
jgi:hypothetical protein